MMKTTVLKTIDKFSLLQPGDKVVAAVSGGPDSVALWHFLRQLKPELKLKLHLAHLNHLLRGKEALADARFVRQLAQDAKELFTIDAQDVAANAKQNKLSIHEAARKLRYQFLYRVAEKQGANKIALGHNADDQAETVLLRLLRGSGPQGLRAMQPRKGQIIRPLLETSRRQIMDFLKQEQLTFRVDSSNLKTKYLRNKLRRELLPVLLQDYNPHLKRNLVQLADILREEEIFWEEYLPAQLDRLLISQDSHQLVLNIQVLKTMPLALQRRLCRRAIEQVQGNLQAINYTHIQQILALIQEQRGEKLLHLPHNLLVTKRYDELEIRQGSFHLPFFMQEYPLIVPGVTEIKELGLRLEASLLPAKEVSWKENPNDAYMDWDKIAQPLYLRRRRPGDCFTPLGMQGSKKLKDFLIDNKVPRSQRESIPLLIGGNEIIWVLGMRISEGVKVTPISRKVLWLQLHP